MTDHVLPPIGECLAACRSALVDGRWVAARLLLDEVGQRPYDLSQAGLPLDSAESYRIPEAFRQLFQDRIDWVNYCIQFAGARFEGVRA